MTCMPLSAHSSAHLKGIWECLVSGCRLSGGSWD